MNCTHCHNYTLKRNDTGITVYICTLDSAERCGMESCSGYKESMSKRRLMIGFMRNAGLETLKETNPLMILDGVNAFNYIENER